MYPQKSNTYDPDDYVEMPNNAPVELGPLHHEVEKVEALLAAIMAGVEYESDDEAEFPGLNAPPLLSSSGSFPLTQQSLSSPESFPPPSVSTSRGFASPKSSTLSLGNYQMSPTMS